MSSPKVLTFTQMPTDEAIEVNRAGVVQYMEFARELHEQGSRLLAELRELDAAAALAAAGGAVVPHAQAEAYAWALFKEMRLIDCGRAALEYAHAYWQSLKHPWLEDIVRAHSEAVAARDARVAAEAQRMRRLGETVDRAVRVDDRVTAVDMKVDHLRPVHSWDDRIKAAIAEITMLADDEQLSRVQAGIAASASESPRDRWLTLEATRLALAQQAKERQQADALCRYTEMQRALRIERMRSNADRCEARLAILVSDLAVDFERELETLAARIDGETLEVADEEALEALSMRIDRELARVGILSDAIAELTRLGYAKVQVMRTLEPSDITSVYLEDPEDDARVACIQVEAEHQLVSAKLVRRTRSDGTSAQRSVDHGAQVRLCQAMARVEEQLAQRWNIRVHSETPPGKAVKAKTNLPTRKRPSTMQGHGKKLQARQL